MNLWSSCGVVLEQGKSIIVGHSVTAAPRSRDRFVLLTQEWSVPRRELLPILWYLKWHFSPRESV